MKLANSIRFIAILILGLVAGAMLAEGAFLVPIWKAMPPKDFIAWYQQYHGYLGAFYAPLEISGAVLILLATTLNYWHRKQWDKNLVLAAVFSLLVLAMFFIYFKNANTAFEQASLPLEEVSNALQTWGNWQWFRILIGMLAFGFALGGKGKT